MHPSVLTHHGKRLLLDRHKKKRVICFRSINLFTELVVRSL